MQKQLYVSFTNSPFTSLLHAVVSLEVEAVHCVVYGKSGVYVHLRSIVNVYVCYVTI